MACLDPHKKYPDALPNHKQNLVSDAYMVFMGVQPGDVVYCHGGFGRVLMARQETSVVHSTTAFKLLVVMYHSKYLVTLDARAQHVEHIYPCGIDSVTPDEYPENAPPVPSMDTLWAHVYPRARRDSGAGKRVMFGFTLP